MVTIEDMFSLCRLLTERLARLNVVGQTRRNQDKIKPDHVDALNNRGAALLRLKRPEDALASYDRAIAVQPDCAEAYRNRGAAFSVLKRYDDALKSYDMALAIKPDFAEAWAGRGDVLLESDRNDQAIESFGRALAHRPDFVEMIFAGCLAELQIQYSDKEKIDERREAYGQKLRTISETIAMKSLRLIVGC